MIKIPFMFYQHFAEQYQKFGLRARHALARWETLCLDKPEVKEVADLIESDPAAWFALCGKSGSGKTHLMVLLSMARLAEGRSVLYTTAYDMALKVNCCPIEDRADKIEDYKRVDHLTIDEINRANKTDALQGLLFEIINARYDDNKQTNIISNLPYNDLFGDRGFFDEAFRRRFETKGIIKNFDFAHKEG